MPKSLEQILGGYATDTLTEEENRQLMEAALHDQALFDALADEEALKALLTDPQTRQRILASLEESQKTLWVASSGSSWFSWFRQPSSLSWMGSIAAMGLALIFGWQMEKDWGSTVQQEEHAERSMSKNRESEKKEIAVRSKKSEAQKTNMSSSDSLKESQNTPDRVAGLSAQVPSTQPSSFAKTGQDSERLRQSLAQIRSDNLTREKVKKERQPKTQESAPRVPESVIVRSVPEDEEDASALAVPEATEKAVQPVARTPSFTDKLQGDRALSSSRSRELFDGEAVADLKEAKEIVSKYTQGAMRGIRYRFVRQSKGDKEIIIDPTKFSGKWSELQLRIDSNVSGHLYVLTAYGSGRWQWMKPLPSNIQRSSDGAMQVKPYQAVKFALSQVTNRLGKPVVSSVTVLFASSPLEVKDLGKWLGSGIRSGQSEERLTQQRSKEKFISDPSLEAGNPLRVTIDLKVETRSEDVLDPMPANEFFR